MRFDRWHAGGWLLDNRPYLRCLHSKGLCLWRLGKMRDAAAVFHKLLWLNPSDNQGRPFQPRRRRGR